MKHVFIVLSKKEEELVQKLLDDNGTVPREYQASNNLKPQTINTLNRRIKAYLLSQAEFNRDAILHEDGHLGLPTTH